MCTYKQTKYIKSAFTCKLNVPIINIIMSSIPAINILSNATNILILVNRFFIYAYCYFKVIIQKNITIEKKPYNAIFFSNEKQNDKLINEIHTICNKKIILFSSQRITLSFNGIRNFNTVIETDSLLKLNEIVQEMTSHSFSKITLGNTNKIYFVSDKCEMDITEIAMNCIEYKTPILFDDALLLGNAPRFENINEKIKIVYIDNDFNIQTEMIEDFKGKSIKSCCK